MEHLYCGDMYQMCHRNVIGLYFLITILLTGMSGLCFAGEFVHPFIPREGRLLIIGQQKDAIDGYIKDTGIVPGGFMVYTSIQEMEGLDSPADHGAGINHAQYYVEKYQNAVIQLGLYMVGSLDGVIVGDYDDNIIKLAQWMKRADRPIYLRIGYEFDLPDNSYDPQKYCQAYRYVVGHLRAQGVDKVVYVWHSASMIELRGNPLDWYPGDDYVDWFAVSIFNATQIKTAKEFSVLAHEHHKPLMIAESSSIGLFSVSGKKEWF